MNKLRISAILLTIFSFCFHQKTLKAQTTLGPNDVVVLWNLAETLNSPSGSTANNDRVGLLLLKAVTAGTEINISDDGTNNCTTIQTVEGEVTYTTTMALPQFAIIDLHIHQQSTSTGLGPANNYANPAGSMSSVGGMALSTGGDQVMVYQGDRTSPTWIYGAFFDGNTWDASCGGSCGSSNSVEPCSGGTFAYGSTATNEYDNSWYTGSLDFTSKAQAVALVNNVSNWTGENGNTGAGDNAADAMYQSTLPVKFTSFKGGRNQNVTLLEWSTSLEINNYGFEIQTSKDGRTFEEIGFVDGQGNTSSNSNYEFSHKTNLSNSHYYRLKQIDLDGNFDYSSVIKVEDSKTAYELSLSPNPSNGFINIVLSSSSKDVIDYSMYDVSGRSLIDGMFNTRKGINKIPVDISMLSRGVYYLKVGSESHKITKI